VGGATGSGVSAEHGAGLRDHGLRREGVLAGPVGHGAERTEVAPDEPGCQQDQRWERSPGGPGAAPG
jgi:hypothetical protein